MPLEKKHQIELLADILRNQAIDCCATGEEYEQLYRMSGHLLQEGEMAQGIRGTIEQIRDYSALAGGNGMGDLYVRQNQHQLLKWADQLQKYGDDGL